MYRRSCRGHDELCVKRVNVFWRSPNPAWPTSAAMVTSGKTQIVGACSRSCDGGLRRHIG